MWEVDFIMGHRYPSDSERFRLPVLFVVLDAESALVLAE